MRAFIAVDAASSLAALQSELASSSGWSPRDVRPVDPRNFHFTLMFLGEVSEQQVEKIRDRLASVKFSPFSMTYTGVGAFPTPRNARAIWVGLDSEGAARLQELAGQVVAKMSGIGLAPDKPFSPHLTMFRAKNRHVRVNVEKYAGKEFGTDTVDRVHLKKSELAPSGPTYSNVYTVTAAKEAQP